MVKPGSENHPVNSSIAGFNLRIKGVCYLPAYRSAAGTTAEPIPTCEHQF